MSKKKKRLAAEIDEMGRRHLINSEYRRGFLEGQRHALNAFAGLVDAMRWKQEEVAGNNTVNPCREEIRFTSIKATS